MASRARVVCAHKRAKNLFSGGEVFDDIPEFLAAELIADDFRHWRWRAGPVLHFLYRHRDSLRLAGAVHGLHLKLFLRLLQQPACDGRLVGQFEDDDLKAFRDALVWINDAFENVLAIFLRSDLREIGTHETVAAFTLVAFETLHRGVFAEDLFPPIRIAAEERQSVIGEVI